jgi:hypothetical protein
MAIMASKSFGSPIDRHCSAYLRHTRKDAIVRYHSQPSISFVVEVLSSSIGQQDVMSGLEDCFRDYGRIKRTIFIGMSNFLSSVAAENSIRIFGSLSGHLCSPTTISRQHFSFRVTVCLGHRLNPPSCVPALG